MRHENYFVRSYSAHAIKMSDPSDGCRMEVASEKSVRLYHPRVSDTRRDMSFAPNRTIGFKIRNPTEFSAAFVSPIFLAQARTALPFLCSLCQTTYFSVDAESNRVIVGRAKIRERSVMGGMGEKTVG